MCGGRREKKLPRIVTVQWVEDGWREDTVLDEERESILLFWQSAHGGQGHRVKSCEKGG